MSEGMCGCGQPITALHLVNGCDIKLGVVLDEGAPEPANVIGVESLVFTDFGDGPEFHIPDETDYPHVQRLHFGRTVRGEWKFYLGRKSYTDWRTLLRRFGPVRVTMLRDGDA